MGTREWLAKVAPQTQPRLVDGKWQRPLLGAIARSQIIKKALAAGVVELEPTRPYIPVFKGHKHERLAPIREATIAEKMKAMPERMREHREARRNARRNLKQQEREKKGLPPYIYD
ncbi:hypothetical protein KFE25_007069 [Diacronema lutheri]|uniref:Large ribosomal subunit protein mL59 domain-containing protein n=1 Tax=Diacronema lutheri TaxID=2081491 RepID=A0A8J5XTB6_DIALT|nr:hypothetical protein KFE25_007069 [Diacronema lutheri]